MPKPKPFKYTVKLFLNAIEITDRSILLGVYKYPMFNSEFLTEMLNANKGDIPKEGSKYDLILKKLADLKARGLIKLIHKKNKDSQYRLTFSGYRELISLNPSTVIIVGIITILVGLGTCKF